jgi:ribosome-associated protein
MDIRKLQRAIVDGLEDVKAQSILVFNTEELSPMFERVIIASGTSNRQTKALASSVRVAVKGAGLPVLRTEGEDNGEWIIVDCGAAVAHIMQPAIRDYYRLEEIWGGKPVRLKLGTAKVGLVKASEEVDEDEEAPAGLPVKKPARPRQAATASSAAGQAALKSGARAPAKSAKPARPAKSASATAPAKAPGATPSAPRKTTAPRKVSVGTVTAKVRTVVVNAPSKKAAAKRASPASKRPKA